MLLLPRLEGSPGEPRVASRPRSGYGDRSRWHSSDANPTASPLSRCFHFSGSTICDFASKEPVPVRRPLWGQTSEDLGSSSPRRSPSSPRPPSSPMQSTGRSEDSWTRKEPPTFAQTAHSPRSAYHTGVGALSMSQAGSWLDARPFAERREEACTLKEWPRHTTLRRKCPGERGGGCERLILKHAKDVLVQRHGSVGVAFARLHLDRNQRLALAEFIDATKFLLRKAEATVLFKVLNKKGDEAVTLNALADMIEGLP